MAEIRTFLAFPIPEHVRKKVDGVIRKLRAHELDLRWMTSTHLHLTLCFLGNVEDRRIPEACQAIEKAVEEQPGFGIQLKGVGAFPDAKRARVVWIGIEDGCEELIGLQRQLTNNLTDAGFGLDRGKYHPHITIGRAKNRCADERLAPIVADWSDHEVGEFDADQLVLYSSNLERNGPIHTAMARFDL